MMSVWFPEKQTLRERFECEQFIGETKDMLCGERGGETEKAASEVVQQPVSAVGTRVHPHEDENCLNLNPPESKGAGDADIN